MVGAAYAAVPLYNWFCRTTGFGGTTQVATAAPSRVLDRKLKVRFDANVAGGLPWRFEPEQNSIEVRIGRGRDRPLQGGQRIRARDRGRCVLQCLPADRGRLFLKDQLFLLHRPAAQAGEKRDMTVVFFVDPEMVKDSEQDSLDTITLSYTMYPARQA